MKSAVGFMVPVSWEWTIQRRMVGAGEIISTDLASPYLSRFSFYDHNSIRLNSAPIVCRDALQAALRVDGLRSRDAVLVRFTGLLAQLKIRIAWQE